MQRIISPTIFTFLLIMVACHSTYAFERRIGARPMGMGDAFVALADDVNAMNYNPAGVAFTEKMAGSLEYANLYPGLDDGVIQENHLVYTQRLADLGAIGIAWNNRSVFGTYHENEFLLGYARGVDTLPLWAGLTAKLYYLAYTDSESRSVNDYFAKESGTVQFGLDLGFLYQFTPETAAMPGINAGLAFFNVTETDLGIKAQAREPIETKIGGSITYKEWDADLDLVYSDSEFQAHAGVEKWWGKKKWGARLGVIGGQGTGLTWTAGGSYVFDLQAMSVRVNYAFNYSFGGIQETAGIHRISLDFYPAAHVISQQVSAPTPGQKRISKKVERIRSYLLGQIKVYFELSDKLIALKDADKIPEAEAAKKALHEAVGKLVWEQDIIGFLRHLRAAEEAVGKIEIGIQNNNGQVQ